MPYKDREDYREYKRKQAQARRDRAKAQAAGEAPPAAGPGPEDKPVKAPQEVPARPAQVRPATRQGEFQPPDYRAQYEARLEREAQEEATRQQAGSQIPLGSFVFTIEQTEDAEKDLKKFSGLCSLLEQFAGDSPVYLKVDSAASVTTLLMPYQVENNATMRMVCNAVCR